MERYMPGRFPEFEETSEVEQTCAECGNDPLDCTCAAPPPEPITPCPDCGGTYAIEGDDPGTLLCHDCGTVYSLAGAPALEGFTFDKFMDATLISENRARTVTHKDTPQRVYAKKYRHHAGEQTRIGGK